MEENTPKEGNGSFHLKKVKHDPIEDLSADKLMANVRKSAMTKGLILSFIFHLIFIGLLSIGFIKLCVEYKDLNPRKIIKENEEKKAEADKQKKREETKLAAIEKAKQEAKGGKTDKASDNKKPGKDGKPLSKVEKDVTETSDDRPVKSAMDSLDDDLE